jgi:hypothetical protein
VRCSSGRSIGSSLCPPCIQFDLGAQLTLGLVGRGDNAPQIGRAMRIVPACPGLDWVLLQARLFRTLPRRIAPRRMVGLTIVPRSPIS